MYVIRLLSWIQMVISVAAIGIDSMAFVIGLSYVRNQGNDKTDASNIINS